MDFFDSERITYNFDIFTIVNKLKKYYGTIFIYMRITKYE